MKIQTALIPGLLVALAAPAAWAQAKQPAAADTPSKVAVISLQAAITGTGEGKQAAAELRAQFSPRTKELQNLQKQIEDIRNRLQAGATTLSNQEKARLSLHGNELTRQYQRDQQDLQDDENEAQQDVFNRIGQKMMTILDKYARQHGYSVVLDGSSQSTPVVYASNQVDITQQIINLYDQTYPVKTAAPPSKPAPKSPPKKH